MDGIHWVLSKRRQGDPEKRVIIEWTPELAERIDEALWCRRDEVFGSFYVFGNQSGGPYTEADA